MSFFASFFQNRLIGYPVFVPQGNLASAVDSVSAALAEKKPRLWPPFLRPDFFFAIIAFIQGKSPRAPLAQLDRASVYGTEGYWFESSGVYFCRVWTNVAKS
jgi:hypothetical protein